jgi:hypothetical protein
MHPIQALLSAHITPEEESIIRASIKGKIATIAIVHFLLSISKGAILQ